MRQRSKAVAMRFIYRTPDKCGLQVSLSEGLNRGNEFLYGFAAVQPLVVAGPLTAIYDRDLHRNLPRLDFESERKYRLPNQVAVHRTGRWGDGRCRQREIKLAFEP